MKYNKGTCVEVLISGTTISSGESFDLNKDIEVKVGDVIKLINEDFKVRSEDFGLLYVEKV